MNAFCGEDLNIRGNGIHSVLRTVMLLAALMTLPSVTADEVDEGERSDRLAIEHVTREIEGWTVRIDSRLDQPKHDDLGRRAEKLLANRLYLIQMMVGEERLGELQQFTIVLDLDHGELRSMQYHPSERWLVSNGYSADLVKCVHIPLAGQFVDPNHHHRQPWAVIHELAHAYHDQVLGFEHAAIKEAWKQAVDTKRYESVLHIDGDRRRHYALTNQKEFFAEMSEAYLGLNDFYPFHRADLKQDNLPLYKLLRSIWGKSPAP